MSLNKRLLGTDRPLKPSTMVAPSSSPEQDENDRLEERTLGFERLVFFSDAVFAIAITLLALEIHVGEIPENLVDTELAQRLWSLWPQLLGFVLGFSVIGAYWVTHHTIFSFIKRYDRTLIWLNLSLLALIALSPFPLSVISEYGDHQPAQIFYAVYVSTMGFTKSLLWWYASHNHRLVSADLEPKIIHQVTLGGLIVPVVFLLSIPFTWLGPVIPIVIWSLTPIISAFLTRWIT